MPKKQRYRLHRCDVSGILACDNGNINTQEYKQRYFYIFKMTDKTGSSNRSSSTAHSRSLQPNESEVGLSRPTTVILPRKKNKVCDHTNSEKVSTNKCVIDGQPEIAVWLSNPEVLISATV